MYRQQRSTSLKVGGIYRGVVSRIDSFGAFVNINGQGGQERGLVHISQLARDRVEAVSDIVEENEEVFVKVLSIDEDGDGRQKISLSMKYCGQGDGSDRDPYMIQYEESMRNRHTRSFDEAKPLELGAIYNTLCSKCGGSGHIASECYNTGSVKYELVPEEETTQLPVQEVALRAPVGRGRGAVIPAWMTEESTLGSVSVRKHKKRKSDVHSDDNVRNKKHKSKDKQEKKEKKDKKSKKEKKEKKEDGKRKNIPDNESENFRHRHSRSNASNKKARSSDEWRYR